MSDAVRTEITIKAPPERIWEFVMDPDHMGDWVTIHKKMLSADDGPPHEGMEMQQCLVLRGASFKVKWKLTECDENRYAVWEGKGPVGSYARTAYELSDAGDGKTRFAYENEFKAPGGLLGRTASMVLVGGLPKKEADASLHQLKSLLEG